MFDDKLVPKSQVAGLTPFAVPFDLTEFDEKHAPAARANDLFDSAL